MQEQNKPVYVECKNTVDYTPFKISIAKFFSKNVLYFILQFYKTYFSFMNALVYSTI